MKIKSEESATYATQSTTNSDDEIIAKAIEILRSRLPANSPVMDCPEKVSRYLTMKNAELPYEVFGALWLNNRHGVITDESLFRGTIDGANVPPREVVRGAIAANAAAVIFYHNHPSGCCDPSTADRRITARLKDALALIDVRVLDHVITGREDTYSFAKHGEI